MSKYNFRRSLRTRKAPAPTKFFNSNNPFITEFEYGQLKELWAKFEQNEVAFVLYYAPWDSECVRARNEIEVVANHYGQQVSRHRSIFPAFVTALFLDLFRRHQLLVARWRM